MSGWAVLTGREIEVATLISEGYTNKEIGQRLGIRGSTVKAHVRRMLPKVGARTRTHLAVLLTREACHPQCRLADGAR